jgi:hypothetical protein
MANLQYFVVRTDEDELQIFYGRKRPAQIPEDADEVGLRFVPLDWKILHACDDEESAEKTLEEELAKLPDQKKDQTKSEE